MYITSPYGIFSTLINNKTKSHCLPSLHTGLFSHPVWFFFALLHLGMVLPRLEFTKDSCVIDTLSNQHSNLKIALNNLLDANGGERGKNKTGTNCSLYTVFLNTFFLFI